MLPLATFGTESADVIDNRARQRFELEVEGHLAMSFYKMDGNVITFIHTEAPAELNGKGARCDPWCRAHSTRHVTAPA